MSASGQLLCTAAYVVSVANGPLSRECSFALRAAADRLTLKLFPCADPSHHLYNEVLDARDSAANQLKEAMNLLNAELELSSLKQSVSHTIPLTHY